MLINPFDAVADSQEASEDDSESGKGKKRPSQSYDTASGCAVEI